MTLISNWKEVLKKAWSIRFSIAAALFGGLEAVCASLDDSILGTPKGLLAGVGALFAAGGIIARILDQSKTASTAS